MRWPVLLVGVLVLAACSDDGGAGASAGSFLDDRGDVQIVTEGYGLLEGPVWDAEREVLLFSEPYPGGNPPDGGAIIHELDADGTVRAFRAGGDRVNGLAFDPDGHLVAAAPAARAVLQYGDQSVAAIATGVDGVPFNEPNDLVVRSDGTIYLTDPEFAAKDGTLGYHGVIRITPDGDAVAERKGPLTEQPNGIALSADESALYVADSEAHVIRTFAVAADGSLADGSVLAHTEGHPDGICLDDDGRLYVVSVGIGLEVFAADGQVVGHLPLPDPDEGDHQPSNCSFGGKDRRTLYVTAKDRLYAVRMPVAGRP